MKSEFDFDGVSENYVFFFSKEWWKEDLPVCNFLQKQVHTESSKSVAAGDGGRQACEAGKKDGEPSPF